MSRIIEPLGAGHVSQFLVVKLIIKLIQRFYTLNWGGQSSEKCCERQRPASMQAANNVGVNMEKVLRQLTTGLQARPRIWIMD
ncbi:hypothetical protein MUP01_08500 [Candidatus Bathyarchaeota archaeon]|nr:hypothetical protein [Candidatus Bathyarchaeota archaeon]